MPRFRFLLAAAGVALVVAPRPADACSLIANGDWQPDTAQASDTTPPAAPTVEITDVHRSEDRSGCGGTSSCGDLATIHLAVSATDDRATAAQLGYELRVVGGTPPAGFDPEAAGRVTPAFGDELVFYFDFAAPSFEVDVEVRAVDANGNLGPPTVVTISDVVDRGGCTTHRANSGMIGFGLTALAAAVALRRRRAR